MKMTENIATIIDTLQKGNFHTGSCSGGGTYLEFNLNSDKKDNKVCLYFDIYDQLIEVEIALGEEEIVTKKTEYETNLEL